MTDTPGPHAPAPPPPPGPPVRLETVAAGGGADAAATLILGEDGAVQSFDSEAERLFHCRAGDAVGQPVWTLLPGFPRALLRQAPAAASQILQLDAAPPDGSRVRVEAALTRIRVGGERVWVCALSEPARRRAEEEALRRSEENSRGLFERAPVGLFQMSPDGHYARANAEAARALGFASPEALRNARADRPAALWDRLAREGVVRDFECEIRRPDGAARWVSESFRAVRGSDGAVSHLEGAVRDVTARREAEETLREAEETLRQSERELGHVFESAPVGLAVLDGGGRIVRANPALARMLGHAADAADALAGAALDGRPGVDVRRAGDVAAVTDAGEREGLRERLTAERAAQARRGERAAALHRAGLALLAAPDRETRMARVLEAARGPLGADAAAILLCDPDSDALVCLAAAGLAGGPPDRAPQTRGFGYAGQAVRERRAVALALTPEVFADDAAVAPLGFASYGAAPLVWDGDVRGVLEVWHRAAPDATTDPAGDGVAGLEELAALSAAALGGAATWDALGGRHAALGEAYEATIEGWGRAMDRRDQESAGHAARVADLTLRLARAVGVSEDALVHVRRGALLHDIGTVGVPDRILLKTEDLSPPEWRLMRRHPEDARAMLAPIGFLAPALDIPWCHHEKWDGSGYPRALAGEAIPLAARLFALVDVWDALSSDRPYRRAWPEGRVLDHIRGLSGTHFDPRLVEAFLAMMGAAADAETGEADGGAGAETGGDELLPLDGLVPLGWAA